jgi:LacI family transcriptional regulator
MKTKGAATIRDLAQAAGVAPSTVSRALNNDPHTNPETITRIKALAEKIGYTQNSTVSQLMAQLRHSRKARYVATIGMVNHCDPRKAWRKRSWWRESDAFLRYWEGAKTQAESRGYELEEFFFDPQEISSKRFADILVNRGIRGLLLWPLLYSLGHLHLPWSSFATVTVGYALTKPRLSYAAADHYQIIAHALHQLHKLHYRRIGLIIDQGFDGYQGGRVLSCYARYKEKKQMEPFIVRPGIALSDTDRSLCAWHKIYQPDVLMILSGTYLNRLHEIRPIVKKQTPYCSLNITSPQDPCTGMNANPEKVGAAAVDLIIEQLHSNLYGAPAVSKAVLIEGTWQRGSTA